MENREFDQLLKDSLAPREQASEECNRAIIDAVRSGEKHPELQKISRFPGRRLLPKVAVIVLVIITQVIQSFGTWLARQCDKRLKEK